MNDLVRVLPDFFVVGKPKSGTTALYEMLQQHQGVFMAEVKEPDYFSFDLRRTSLPWWLHYPVITTMDGYLQLFAEAAPDQRCGEASTSYLFSRVAADRIAEHNPEARLVAIFREPAEFLRSLHLQYVESHMENQHDLRKALALEPLRAAGRKIPRRCTRPQNLAYSEHLKYSEQLLRFRAAFPADQMLTLIYDDYLADTVGTVRRVLEFVGVDAGVPIETVRTNRSVGVRSQNLEQAVRWFSFGEATGSNVFKRAIKTVLPRSWRQQALRYIFTHVVHRDPPAVDEELMSELRRSCKDEVERFSGLIDRDLVKLWGYDHL